MNPLFPIVCLVWTAITTIAIAHVADTPEPITLPQVKLEVPAKKTPEKNNVPEPNSLLALAFAGVVILARHRFRP